MTYSGTKVTVDGRPALRFERRYGQPLERVWHAVTDPAEMAHWFPSNVQGERAEGADLTFVDDAQRAAAREAGEPTRADGPAFRGRVVAYHPQSEFSFTWGGELLRIELAPDGDGTRLVFTHVLSHESVAARTGAGWHLCLGALDRLLGAPEPAGFDDWSGVYSDYLERLGPALGHPSGEGGMTWERATHVDPDRVRAATTDHAETEAWGGAGRAAEPVSWDLLPTTHGTVYRLTHHGIRGDAELAATWHALLLQLDMYLAAGQLVSVDPGRWVGAYESVLAG